MKSNMQTSTHAYSVHTQDVPSLGCTIYLLESKDGSSVAIAVLYKTGPLFPKNINTTRTDDLKHGTASQICCAHTSCKVRAQKHLFKHAHTSPAGAQ